MNTCLIREDVRVKIIFQLRSAVAHIERCSCDTAAAIAGSEKLNTAGPGSATERVRPTPLHHKGSVLLHISGVSCAGVVHDNFKKKIQYLS